MKFPSLNLLLSVLFFGFVLKTIWNFAQIFIPPTCNDGETCVSSYLIKHPKQDLCVFTSVKKNPSSNDISKILEIKDFDYNVPSTRTLSLQIPYKTRNNGTLYLHIALGDSRERGWSWDETKARSSIERIPLVVYSFPQAETFHLLENKAPDFKPKSYAKPVAHLKSSVTFSVLSDPLKFHLSRVPAELVRYLRLTRDEFLPIIQYNFLKSRARDLIEIKNSNMLNVSLDYSPASIGKMRLLVQLSLALESLHTVGFSEKNIDEVKEIFADTNLYLICATTLISSVHLFFDFLAFKSDISFWRAKKSMAGLSFRSLLWRVFSQTIITLYLFDENTSMLILIPCVIGTLIELWKVKKMLHIEFDWKERMFIKIITEKVDKAELRTKAVDAEAMKYLSYILYPLCICGAVYSLLYEPHKSWSSWTLHSLVNGIYAFGFLFMLPQLFINYKLKSVAALSWRSFMYKAFNTFIDDVFAFIITMPTAHRVACVRDDIIFLIYLYQRWLYPVDKSRVDDSLSIEETVDVVHEKKE